MCAQTPPGRTAADAARPPPAPPTPATPPASPPVAPAPVPTPAPADGRHFPERHDDPAQAEELERQQDA